jgi:RNA polymerase sigma factor (TIGR02999 family)
MPPMADLPSLDTRQRVTTLLDGLQAGEGHSSDELFTLVYADLRRLAAARMARLTPGQTLQATALVHEAYVSLVGSSAPGWKGRAHFFGSAARAMRNILADHLEGKRSLRRGGHLGRAGEKTTAGLSQEGPGHDELVVEEALQALAQQFPRKAEIVTLSFFGGLDTLEIAEVLKLSPRTVERDWQFAKAWLNSRLGGRERTS